MKLDIEAPKKQRISIRGLGDSDRELFVANRTIKGGKNDIFLEIPDQAMSSVVISGSSEAGKPFVLEKLEVRSEN